MILTGPIYLLPLLGLLLLLTLECGYCHPAGDVWGDLCLLPWNWWAGLVSCHLLEGFCCPYFE